MANPNQPDQQKQPQKQQSQESPKDRSQPGQQQPGHGGQQMDKDRNPGQQPGQAQRPQTQR